MRPAHLTQPRMTRVATLAALSLVGAFVAAWAAVGLALGSASSELRPPGPIAGLPVLEQASSDGDLTITSVSASAFGTTIELTFSVPEPMGPDDTIAVPDDALLVNGASDSTVAAVVRSGVDNFLLTGQGPAISDTSGSIAVSIGRYVVVPAGDADLRLVDGPWQAQATIKVDAVPSAAAVPVVGESRVDTGSGIAYVIDSVSFDGTATSVTYHIEGDVEGLAFLPGPPNDPAIIPGLDLAAGATSCSSHQRCLQAGGRRSVADGSVRPGVVVVIQERLEGSVPFRIAEIRPEVRPLPLQRLVERFSFAVGLGPVGLRTVASDGERVGRRDEGPGATVVQGIVREDALDRDAGQGERLDGPQEEASGGRPGLVREGLRIGKAAVVVHGDMHEVMATFGPGPMTPRAALGEARIEALASTLGDAPELLHIQVHQLARPFTLVADDGTGRAIKAGKDGKPVTPQDTVDRRRSHPEFVGDAMGPSAQLTPQCADRLDDRLSKRVRQASRTTRAVPQAFDTFLAVALPPLRDGTAGDALGLGDLRLGPTFLQPGNEQQPTVLVELRVSMGH